MSGGFLQSSLKYFAYPGRSFRLAGTVLLAAAVEWATVPQGRVRRVPGAGLLLQVVDQLVLK